MRSCLLSIQPFFTYFFNAALTKKSQPCQQSFVITLVAGSENGFLALLYSKQCIDTKEQCVTEALTPLNTHDWLTSSSRRQAERFRYTSGNKHHPDEWVLPLHTLAAPLWTCPGQWSWPSAAWNPSSGLMLHTTKKQNTANNSHPTHLNTEWTCRRVSV